MRPCWGAVEGRVDQGDEQPVAAQLQLQPQVGAGVDHGVGDQLVGHQHGPVDQGFVGAGELPGPADLADKGSGGGRRGRGRASRSSSRRWAGRAMAAARAAWRLS
jgi:hypothetical protein